MRLSIRAQLAPCPRCGSAILAARTRPPAAFDVRADPAPLAPAGEILALAAGRMTYDLVKYAGQFELINRDQWRIRRRDWPVVADHKCPGPIPWAAIPPPPEPETSDDGEPPF